MIELLFARGEDKVGPAIDTFQNPILKFWHGTILEGKGEARCQPLRLLSWLFDFPGDFLPVPFARQCLLDPQFFARLQIERMPFDLFDNVFLLHFPFEAPEGVFQGFTLLEPYFSQN